MPAMVAIPKFSMMLTVLRGTFRVVPKQAHFNSLSLITTAFITPNPLTSINNKVIILVSIGENADKYNKPIPNSIKLLFKCNT